MYFQRLRDLREDRDLGSKTLPNCCTPAKQYILATSADFKPFRFRIY